MSSTFYLYIFILSNGICAFHSLRIVSQNKQEEQTSTQTRMSANISKFVGLVAGNCGNFHLRISFLCEMKFQVIC
jgi:hypothetical protein